MEESLIKIRTDIFESGDEEEEGSEVTGTGLAPTVNLDSTAVMPGRCEIPQSREREELAGPSSAVENTPPESGHRPSCWDFKRAKIRGPENVDEIQQQELSTIVPQSRKRSTDDNSCSTSGSKKIMTDCQVNDAAQNIARRTSSSSSQNSSAASMTQEEARRTSTSKRTRKTAEQIRLLESKFAETETPTVVDVHELTKDIGLESAKIYEWFRKQRKTVKRMTVRSDAALASGADEGILGSTPELSQNRQRTGRHFITKPSERRVVTAVEVREELARLQNIPIERFKTLINGAWNVKASRIFGLIVGSEDSSRRVVQKEAKRLAHICGRNVFSEDQQRLIHRWEREFISNHSTNAEEKLTNKNLLTQFVCPWMVPVIYSRMVLQDGMHISLEVALSDFAKLGTNYAKKGWCTPTLIVYEL